MKRLAIVGSGTETRDAAPWGDASFDIWVFNEAANSAWCKRWDACFQMHKPEIYTGHNTKDAKHFEWLQQDHGAKKIYMQGVDYRIPNSTTFPQLQASQLIGMDYFTSTFAYMCAQAIIDAYSQVDIYGVEMSFSEYQYQAEGFRFWVGYLMGAGVHVNLHSGRKMFDAPMYGYDGNFSFGADYFARRANDLHNEFTAATRKIEAIRTNIGRAVQRLEFDHVVKLSEEYQSAALECGEVSGALSEAERYEKFGDRYADRGGFEFAAASGQAEAEKTRVQMYAQAGKAEYVWNVWKQTKNPVAAQQLLQIIGAMGEFAEKTGATIGIYKENLSYMAAYDGMVRANGGLKVAA